MKQREILRHQNYSVRLLTEETKEQALNLLISECATQQPYSIGFRQQFRESDSASGWAKLQRAYKDYSALNGSSVVLIDLNNKEELVGASVTRDPTFSAKGLKQGIENDPDMEFLIGVSEIQKMIVKKLSPEIQQALKTPGKVLYIRSVALKKQHMGKRLLHRMMLANEILAKEQGFQYTYVYALNVRSGVAAQKLGYEKVGQVDSHQLQMNGKKPFALVDEASRYTAIWMKKLIE